MLRGVEALSPRKAPLFHRGLEAGGAWARGWSFWRRGVEARGVLRFPRTFRAVLRFPRTVPAGEAFACPRGVSVLLRGVEARGVWRCLTTRTLPKQALD